MVGSTGFHERGASRILSSLREVQLVAADIGISNEWTNCFGVKRALFLRRFVVSINLNETGWCVEKRLVSLRVVRSLNGSEGPDLRTFRGAFPVSLLAEVSQS